MNILTSFVCGLLFGLGLMLGGMTNPAKVIAFLDLGGAWDPSLALVMGGARTGATISPSAPSNSANGKGRLARKRLRPVSSNMNSSRSLKL